MAQDVLGSTPTLQERIDALEYLLGQALLSVEADSVSTHAQLDRLERAIAKLAPNALAAPSEEESKTPFTMDDLGRWMALCLERMRAHQSVHPRLMVAIGEATSRVLGLGEDLGPDTPPPSIGEDALAALRKAQRPNPPAQPS